MEAVRQKPKSKTHKSRTSSKKRAAKVEEPSIENVVEEPLIENVVEEVFEDVIEEPCCSDQKTTVDAAIVDTKEIEMQRSVQATAPLLSYEQIADTKTTNTLLVESAAHNKFTLNKREHVAQSTIYPHVLLNETVERTDQLNIGTDVLGNREIPAEEKPKAEYRNLYPTLRSIESEILDYRAVIVSHKEQYAHRTNILAVKELHFFNKAVTELEGHEFFLLMIDFQNSRDKLLKAQLKATVLQRTLKNLEFGLWKEVAKKVTSKGKCGDGNLVSVSKPYFVMEFDKEDETKIHHHLGELKESILPLLAFEKYNVHYLKLKIEVYIYLLVENTQPYNESNLPYSLFTSLTDSTPKIETVRKCLSILFYFQRKPTSDAEFIQLGRKWILNLVSYVFTNGSDSDRIFVLNHILRCPADIKSWASSLIQFPGLLRMSSSSSEQNSFHYALTSLMIVLCPIPDRDEFLKEVNKCTFHQEPCPPDCGFTLLSDDGQEVEELKFRKVWYDSDVQSILRQVPLLKMLKHSTELSGDEKKAFRDSSEIQTQRLLAFSSFLLDILFTGLKTYSPSVYVNSAKAIGNLISSTLNYLCDFWAKYKMQHPVFNCCLQVEMDRLIFQCVLNLLKRQCMLSLLLDCSFDIVSSKMLWNLLWLFHSDPNTDENELFSVKDVEFKLKDENVRSLLRNQITSFSDSDKINVLQALKQMSLSRCAEKEYKFYIALEMFEVFCDVRHGSLMNHFSLISAITDCEPSVISFLLKHVSVIETEDILKCAVSLFNELCLDKWMPSMTEDMDTLSNMLLLKPVTSQHNQLSRLILRKLNWNFKDGELVLPIEYHRYVGILVVKAFLQHQVDGQNYGDSTGITQMLLFYPLGLFVNWDSNKAFVAWAWPLLFSLKLHALSHPRPPWIQIFDGDADHIDIPNINVDPSLHTLLLAYQQKNPAACYLVISMTKVGHMLKFLSSDGLSIISTLVELKQYAAAVQSLYLMLPFFTKNQELLLSNEKFLTSFANLLTADQLPCNNDKTVVGSVLTKIRDMIKIQLYEAGKVLVECVSPIIKLYVQLLVKILLMDAKGRLKLGTAVNQIYFFLDLVLKIAFVHSHTRDGVFELLCEITRPLLHEFEVKKQSSWFFRSAEKLSPLLPQPMSNFSYFTFYVILAEGNQKLMRDIWFMMQNEMTINISLTTELSFKNAASVAGLPAIPLQILPIYRWAAQALVTPLDHPILPLVWQQFFLCYLQRVSDISGTSSNNSIAKRFFENGSNQKLFIKLKSRLKEALEFYCRRLDDAREKKPSKRKTGSPERESAYCSEELNLFHLFRGFDTWINCPKLHGTICFADLAPNYNPQLLELVFKNDQSLWFQYVSLEKVESEVRPSAELWAPVENTRPMTAVKKETPLQAEVNPVAPPVVKENQPPMPVISVDVSSVSRHWLDTTINHYQKFIYEETSKFDQKLFKMEGLDERYKYLLPNQYKMEKQEHQLVQPCYMKAKCTGPARFKLLAEKIVKNDDVHARMCRNRSEYENILSSVLGADSKDLCNATLEMEVILRKLVNVVKANPHGSRSKELQKICTDLFYDLFERIEKVFSAAKDNSFSCYSPTNQFFATCIEILGKEISLDHQEHCHNLLKNLLKNPMASQLASSYFTPNQLPEYSFIIVYRTLVDAMPSHSASALFVFFSKVKLAKWMVARKASFACRKELLNLAGIALAQCGAHPSTESQPLYEIIKKHFLNIYLQDFPELFSNAISVLLRVMENGALNVDLWYEVFNSLGCSVKREEKDEAEVKSAMLKFAQNRSLPPNEKLFISCPSLHMDQVIQTLDHFHNFFMDCRKDSAEPLYKKFKPYLKELGIFLAMMGHSLVEQPSGNVSKKNVSSRIAFLWSYLHKSFQPWTDPSIGKTQFPWSYDELADAHTMFKMFAMCIETLHEEFRDNIIEDSMLTHAWNYYVKTYIDDNKRNYFIIVCHTAFANLPWETFHPSVSDVRSLFQVLESPIPESQLFAIEIALKVQWIDVTSRFASEKSPEFMENYLSYVARFFVRAAWVHLTTKKSKHQKILKDLEKLPWNFIKPETLSLIFSMYSTFCTPKNLLLDETTDCCDVYTLNFLKVVSGFVSRNEMLEVASIHSDTYIEKKRQIYLVNVVELHAKCFIQHQDVVEKSIIKFCQMVPSHMSEIESIILKDFTPSDQMARSSVLVKELLCFVNMIGHHDIRNQVLRAIVAWLKTNSKSPLLLPCIQIACTALLKVSTIVPIVECCITARYNTELQDPSEANDIWNILSSCLHIPMNNPEEMIKFCIEQNACFCLYKYVLQRICSSTNSQGKVLLFRKMLCWIDEMKPSKNSEPKMLLLWDQILLLSLTVIEDDDLLTVKNGLSQFSATLTKLAEEGSGLLSFFSKSAAYSVNFRFLCRAMSAYILTQLPANGSLRTLPLAAGHWKQNPNSPQPQKTKENHNFEPLPSANATKAVKELKQLMQEKPYAALKSQIEKILCYITEPQYCLLESRTVLKELAVQVFPNHPHLHLLSS